MKHDMTMQEIFQLSQMLVQTQGILPPTIRTPGECVAIILAGRELGLPAMASLRLITLVKGKVTIDASGQVALMQSAGAKVHWLNDGTDGKGVATLRVTRPGEEPYTTSFTLEMAKQAGLLSNAMWTKYPDKMLRARCVSSVGKAYYADVLAGVYLPGEIADDPRTEGRELESTAGGRPMLTATATVSQTIPASPPPPALQADNAQPRTITQVLADIAACEHVDKLEPLLNEARGLYKSLTPALQAEVVAVGKAAPEQVRERQALRLEREEADRALGGKALEPGANDSELDPVDAAIGKAMHVADGSDMEGVF